MILKYSNLNFTNEMKFLLASLLFLCAVIFTCGEPQFKSSSFSDVDQKSARDPLCPDEDAIAPCTCYTDVNDTSYIVMDCSNIESELQLRKVFLADFPTREFSTFTMQLNSRLTRLGNVFGGATFKYIYLYSVMVDTITDDCFIDSADTLEFFMVDGSYINTTNFPFNTIKSYSNLTYLDISSSRLESFPVDLASNSLSDLRMNANGMTGILPAEPFTKLPNLTNFEIWLNQLSGIEPGAFASVPLLKSVSFFHNAITVLKAGTFVLSTDAYIEILANQITAVEPRAITKLSNDLHVSISLGANMMTEIRQDVWVHLLAYNTTSLDLSSNPLECGCDVGWLILNPMYLGQMNNYTACSDGRLLNSLEFSEFHNCTSRSL